MLWNFMPEMPGPSCMQLNFTYIKFRGHFIEIPWHPSWANTEDSEDRGR